MAADYHPKLLSVGVMVGQPYYQLRTECATQYLDRLNGSLQIYNAAFVRLGKTVTKDGGQFGAVKNLTAVGYQKLTIWCQK